MAYDATKETTEEIASIEKNTRGEVIKLARVTNNASKMVQIDIRLFYTDPAGALKPTSKGVRVPEKIKLEMLKALTTTLTQEEAAELIKYMSEGSEGIA